MLTRFTAFLLAVALAVAATPMPQDAAAPPAEQQPATLSPLGGKEEALTGIVAATSSGPTRIDLLARATNNRLFHRCWHENKWTAWTRVRDWQSPFDPSCVATDANRLECFATGTGTQLRRSTLADGRWSDSDGIGGSLAGGPSCTSNYVPGGPPATRMDCVARWRDDNSMRHWAWRDKKWQAIKNLGGTFASDPVCMGSEARLVCYAINSEGALQKRALSDENPDADWVTLPDAVNKDCKYVGRLGVSNLPDSFLWAQTDDGRTRLWLTSTWQEIPRGAQVAGASMLLRRTNAQPPVAMHLFKFADGQLVQG